LGGSVTLVERPDRSPSSNTPSTTIAALAVERNSSRGYFVHRAGLHAGSPREIRVCPTPLANSQCLFSSVKSYIPHFDRALFAFRSLGWRGTSELLAWTVGGGRYRKQLEYLRLHLRERIRKLFDQAVAIIKGVLGLVLEKPEDLFNRWCFGCTTFRQRAE